MYLRIAGSGWKKNNFQCSRCPYPDFLPVTAAGSSHPAVTHPQSHGQRTSSVTGKLGGVGNFLNFLSPPTIPSFLATHKSAGSAKAVVSIGDCSSYQNQQLTQSLWGFFLRKDFIGSFFCYPYLCFKVVHLGHQILGYFPCTACFSASHWQLGIQHELFQS